MILQKLRQRLADDQRGFTLIELLIVIVIIGILIAIAVPSYLGFRERANEKAALANVRAAVPAVETYFSDNSGAAGETGADGDATTSKYSGLSVANLQAIDQAVELSAAAAVGTAPSAASYCIASTVGGKTAKKAGPSADVVIGTC